MKKNHTIIMIQRLCLIGFVIASSAFVSACQSKVEHVNDLCGELKQTAMLTDNCSKMAKKLSKLTPEFKKAMDMKMPDNEEAQLKYTQAISHCMSAYLEISTGACGNDPAVRNAMPKK